jgi:hypothetical protein
VPEEIIRYQISSTGADVGDHLGITQDFLYSGELAKLQGGSEEETIRRLHRFL